MDMGELFLLLLLWVYIIGTVYFWLKIDKTLYPRAVKPIGRPLTEKEKEEKYIKEFKKRHPGIYESTFTNTEIN